MKFLVYADLILIGWSLLENGDPPMGCVSGVFFPSKGYALVVSTVREITLLQETAHTNDSERINQIESMLNLSVRMENGETLQPVGGVKLTDYYKELGEIGREVHIIGLHHQIFDKYFPLLREQYDGQWK